MKKFILPAITLIFILSIIMIIFKLSSEKTITSQTEIQKIKNDSNLDIIINLYNFSQTNHSESRLLDIAMQCAIKSNLMTENTDDGNYFQYITKNDLHSLIFELTGITVEAPIEIEDFYYLYDSENEYYYCSGMSPSYFKVSKINSVNRSGSNYLINCSVTKDEEGEKIQVDNVLLKLKYLSYNQNIKYQITEIRF